MRVNWKIYETKSPKSTLLADNIRGLITTKQKMPRPVASAAQHRWRYVTILIITALLNVFSQSVDVDVDDDGELIQQKQNEKGCLSYCKPAVDFLTLRGLWCFFCG